MQFFRFLAILCAISALLFLGFWIADAVTGITFRFGWVLFSSILWALVFELVHRYLERKGQPKNLL